jgi:cytochrome c
MKNVSLYVLLVLTGFIALLEACRPRAVTQKSGAGEVAQAEALPPVSRPREAWVWRSVLDQQPRMLSAELHPRLWVAYNTASAALYKAWAGRIRFDGPVYTSAHGPQPTSEGPTYWQEPAPNPWRLNRNGAEQTPTVHYRGHSVLHNRLTLNYDLVYEDVSIRVAERPEFVSETGDQVTFERVFTTSGVPAGLQLSLNMHLSPLTAATDFKTDGKFTPTKQATETFGDRSFQTIAGNLVLNNNGRTTFTVALTPKPSPPKPPAEPVKSEEAVFALMAKSDCNTCHNKEVKTIGPAYVAIAEKYARTAQNQEALVTKVIKGGAGNWGQIPMTPHPNLPREDAAAMVAYILSLDAGKEGQAAKPDLMPKVNYAIRWVPLDPARISAKTEKPGLAVNAYQFAEIISDFKEITGEMLPVFSGSINGLHADDNGFGELKENFIIHATGTVNMAKTTNLVFRLVSDDGSRLYIDNKLVIDNGGNHPMEAKDGELILKAGKHPIRVEYYQGGAGKGLSLQWRPYGAKAFTVVPTTVFSFKGADIKRTQTSPVTVNRGATPGDGAALDAVHPSFTLAQARPASFQPKVGGMDFLPDGRLVVSTWDSLGAVFLLEGVAGNDPEAIKVKRIAFGLAEPLGVKVVDNEIYVMQKQELTRLVDRNKDDVIDEYQTVCNGWRVSANFHEFAFGLLYQDGYFFGTLATAINPGGASTKPQIPDRGRVVKIARQDGSFSFVASGLRTPNGIGFGVDKEIFIADNQGDWLPSSKIVHLQPGAWYGSRSVDFEGTADTPEALPVVWLPQDEIGNSPSEPAPLNVGPYQNQMIHGDVTHGGIKRVFAEKVNGAYQGVVFRFTQGLEAGVNRLAWGPDGALYVGGVGSTGNWQHNGKLGYGLQRLTFNNKITFEMLAIRARPNGIEIEFTEALKAGSGDKAADYGLRQFYYKPTGEYGGPKLDDQPLNIKAVTVSADRKKVLLQLAGLKPNHVVYVRLNKQTMRSASDQTLWSTEAWYTMNQIPAN